MTNGDCTKVIILLGCYHCKLLITYFKFLMRKFHYSTHKYNKIREVGFRVLGHDFRLVLSPKRGLLHSKFKAVEIVDDEGSGNQTELRIPIDHESFYEGRLFGELDSKASVHMEVQNNYNNPFYLRRSKTWWYGGEGCTNPNSIYNEIIFLLWCQINGRWSFLKFKLI